ncbi:MAG: MurR/RpiR family transcriptional regulator [Erysipelotrichaceae bacterium]|uniref:MurR/RpiR family transcriptional regulator n=1 Tax=Anaerorhabdus sp. TaxID=1872524 RepID=UPI002FCAB297
MEINELTVEKNIKDSYENLFSAEKKAAEYVLDNLDEVVMLSVSELAKKCEVSEATIVRACKHLGYSGYYQMRLLLARDTGKNEMHENKKEVSNLNELFEFHSERILNLSKHISVETLVDVSKILLQARNTHIVGVGNTVPIVLDLGFRLQRYGVSCNYSMIPEQFYNYIMLGSENDALIAISRTGASTAVIRAVEMAYKKGMKIIVITGELNKQFVENADVIIKVVEKNSGFEIKPDSHLIEFAINEAILYMVKKNKDMNKNGIDINNKENIEMLLSEFKL